MLLHRLGLLLPPPTVDLGQRALAAVVWAARLKATATTTSVQETLPELAVGVPKTKNKQKKRLQKEEALGATEARCPGNTHPASWPRLLKQSHYFLGF